MTSDEELTRRLIGFGLSEKEEEELGRIRTGDPHVKVVFAILSSFKASEKLR